MDKHNTTFCPFCGDDHIAHHIISVAFFLITVFFYAVEIKHTLISVLSVFLVHSQVVGPIAEEV